MASGRENVDSQGHSAISEKEGIYYKPRDELPEGGFYPGMSTHLQKSPEELAQEQFTQLLLSPSAFRGKWGSGQQFSSG